MRRCRGRRLTGMVAIACAVAGGCAGDRASQLSEPPAPSDAPRTGALELSVNGLGGVEGLVRISGPGGFFRTLTTSERLTGLAATIYTVSASAVQSALFDYAPSPSEFLVTVVAGSTSTATVSYAPTTGSLTLSTTGLPADRDPSIGVSGGGYSSVLTASGSVGRLRPGVYSISASPVPDVSLRYAAPNTAVTVTAGVTKSVVVDYALLSAARSSTDRPDDVTGAQLKVLYAVPADGIDRGLDTTGVLSRSTSSWQRWLASQANGRHLRLETVGGRLDVRFVRLPRTDAAYRVFGPSQRDTLERDLASLGVVSPSAQKVYLLYYDGSHVDECGRAALPPEVNGRLAAIFLQGRSRGGAPCSASPFAETATSPPGYLEYVAVHEVMHLLGLVSLSAPDRGPGGHVRSDATDLMYAGDAPWSPSHLDQARRNYYNPAGLPAGMANLVASPFVITP